MDWALQPWIGARGVRSRFQLIYGFAGLLGLCSACTSGPANGDSAQDNKNDDDDGKADDDDNDNDDDDDNDQEDESTGDDSTDKDSDEPTWMTRFPRLTHLQWENAIQDLFFFDEPTGLSAAFPPDQTTHFDTHIGHKKIGTSQWVEYQRAAESIAQRVARSAERLDLLIPKDAPQNPDERAQAVIEHFGRRVFRRPLDADELQRYFDLYREGEVIFGGEAFANGMELVIEAMLQAPQFLYRMELSPANGSERIALSDYEIASRLAFTLLDTTPNDDLLDAAETGDLSDDGDLRQWAMKLLDHPRAARKLNRFHEQLFRISNYESATKDPKTFPDFDAELVAMLMDEARLFLDEILIQQSAGIATLLTSNITYVNRKTAPLYGLLAPNDDQWQRVELDAKERSGLLTQLGFLSKHAGLFQSDPIHRGVGINLDLLCRPLVPPPVTPPLPEIKPDQTNRERIEEHTKDCGGACHNQLINPIGFAFEHYDAVGQWRQRDNGKAVDATASYLLDGKNISYNGAVELMQELAKSSDLHRCYAKNWLEFALGYVPEKGERMAIESLAANSLQGDGAWDLLVALIQAPVFRTRAPER